MERGGEHLKRAAGSELGLVRGSDLVAVISGRVLDYAIIDNRSHGRLYTQSPDDLLLYYRVGLLTVLSVSSSKSPTLRGPETTC